jgi:hypothetical protein
MHEKLNILANSKLKSKIFQDVYQEPGWVCLAKSLKTKKSHASVPLSLRFPESKPSAGEGGDT